MNSGRGPGERNLDDLSARGALWLRAVIVGLCGGFGLVADDRHAATAAIVVIALTALSLAQLPLRTRSPAAAFAANAVVVAGIGLSQLYLGPQPYSGWLVATASVASITCYFEWPDRQGVAFAVAGLTIVSYTAGCVLAGSGLPVLPAGRMVAQSLLGFLGVLMIHRVARVYDRLNTRLVRRRATAAAAKARQAAERDYLAVLHDTASTTFLMVSTGATTDFDWLPEQARRDLDLLSTEWTPPEEMDLAELLATLADYPGLDVRQDLHGPLILPSDPAMAIYHGVREALSNTRTHAGDRTATMSAHEEDGRVEVRVADQGNGFDPSRVRAHRYGLSASIVGRMTAAGGTAEIDSAPGRGTTVTWHWVRG